MTTSTPTKRYEYKIVPARDSDSQKLWAHEYETDTLQLLNELGNEGWRVISKVEREAGYYHGWLLVRESERAPHLEDRLASAKKRIDALEEYLNKKSDV